MAENKAKTTATKPVEKAKKPVVDKKAFIARKLKVLNKKGDRVSKFNAIRITTIN